MDGNLLNNNEEEMLRNMETSSEADIFEMSPERERSSSSNGLT
jgi:hypothetical protein